MVIPSVVDDTQVLVPEVSRVQKNDTECIAKANAKTRNPTRTNFTLSPGSSPTEQPSEHRKDINGKSSRGPHSKRARLRRVGGESIPVQATIRDDERDIQRHPKSFKCKVAQHMITLRML